MSGRTYQKPGEWVESYGGNVPSDAVSGGVDQSGETIYVARANHEGDYIPGKLVPSHGVCYIPWGGKEIGVANYQVLVNKSDSVLDWVKASDGDVPPGSLQGGLDESGEMLYVGRSWHEDSLTIGKVHRSHKVCYLPFGGEEISKDNYEVLVCKTVQIQN